MPRRLRPRAAAGARPATAHHETRRKRMAIARDGKTRRGRARSSERSQGLATRPARGQLSCERGSACGQRGGGRQGRKGRGKKGGEKGRKMGAGDAQTAGGGGKKTDPRDEKKNKRQNKRWVRRKCQKVDVGDFVTGGFRGGRGARGEVGGRERRGGGSGRSRGRPAVARDGGPLHQACERKGEAGAGRPPVAGKRPTTRGRMGEQRGLAAGRGESEETKTRKTQDGGRRARKKTTVRAG